MKTPSLCIPVMGRTVTAMIAAVKGAQPHADYLELRVDYIKGLSPADIKKLYRIRNKKVIFTCRSRKEGGKFQGSEAQRWALLQAAFDIGFPYVDLELATIKRHRFCKPKNTKLILSYHNFLKTPAYPDLAKIIAAMSRRAPTIYKIATWIKKTQDIETLFRLLADKKGKRMIVVGMGEQGKIVRLLAPYLGSFMTFASGDRGGSAPGQLHYRKLKRVYRLLELVSKRS